MSAAVQTAGLTKRYGDLVAVDSLDMRVRAGEVYGFLGPNGAGKTTTLRMLLGLVRPTAGTIRILGAARWPGRGDQLARVGALVEGPAFYPFLSGHDNLRALATRGSVQRSRVGEVLELVGLADRAGDRFASYSLGMKQRLGLAAALLKRPDLLVLDEPTNGLDPSGMAEMRDTLRQLRRRRLHGALEQPPAGRGPADLRPGRRHQPRPAGRRAADQRAGRRRQPPRGGRAARPGA
jgi:ABC-2 type transport system ATP-binding protein